ncbi:hypothetical protein BU15DRAFT_83094 [Melanogaster broomeanus]|nr:hypothetical protein BU15DRAFT_83094 [Melanogaster broomeanus]
MSSQWSLGPSPLQLLDADNNEEVNTLSSPSLPVPPMLAHFISQDESEGNAVDEDPAPSGLHPQTHCARFTPPKPQTASQMASEAAADAVNPNTTSAGPTGPAGDSARQHPDPEVHKRHAHRPTA